jgi:hypothetical protein
MASSNNQINLNNLDVVELDYNALKASLKNFLRGQSQFKDFDYDGPNIGTLLRLLSYNTYINAFYTNMALAEAHLDSAQLRSSILSHAKDLNYLPRSVRSSKARVKVAFEATGQNAPYTIQKGSTFSAVVKNTSYTFSIPESITVASANNSFEFESDIYEGFFVQDSYVIKGTDNERFRITNKNVDTQSLTVTVFEDGDTIGQVYIEKRNLLDLTNESKVFFLQTAEDGYYEVLFGDNIIGRRPKTNATITLDYRITEGPDADGAKKFGIDFDPTGFDELNSSPVITTIESSRNAQEEESDESVRYFAPRSFQVQERTVVQSDYEVALRDAFPEINVVHAYGGEELDPPRMSKVVIAVDISQVDGLPDSKIQEYSQFIQRRSPFGIEPIFVEPEYLYLEIDSTIRYNVNITTNSDERIGTLVKNAILSYNDVYLDDFDVQFRDSQLLRTIDFADVSIVSNVTDVRMYKKLNPITGVSAQYVVNFGYPIDDSLYQNFGSQSHVRGRKHAFKSSNFTYSGIQVWLEDDGVGNIHIVRQSGDSHTQVLKIGTINYDTGQVKLSNFVVDAYEGSSLRLYAFPADKDVQTTNNTILRIESAEIKLTIEKVRE